MKINIDKYNKHTNGSMYYKDHDEILIRTFNSPTRDNKNSFHELFSPRKRTGSKYPSRHIFQIHFNEDGITVEVTGRDDDKTIKVWELKQVVEYVSDFYNRLYDNGFLISESGRENVKGEWLPHPIKGNKEWDVCSACGVGCKRREYGIHANGKKWVTEYNFNFCPNCGADMRGDKS